MIAPRLARAAVAMWIAASIVSAPAFAKKPAFSYYLTTSEVDLSQLLEPPPAPTSNVGREDTDTMAAVEAQRTQADLDAAQADSKRTVFSFGDVIGSAFVQTHLPLTAALFAHTSGDTELLVQQAKAYFDRPRPEGVRQTHGSYPSGHAAFAACTAILLAEMIPERRDAIFRRAEIFADRRIVAGVHYPSDVEAGWIAGTLVAYALMRQPRFDADFRAARNELRNALGLPAVATSGASGTFEAVLTSQK
ncbi:MAG TPA: phosphatase PAP2 family protein [Candidatus Tumulicola sp.]|jgi:acid phosphatase (class A)